MVRIQVMPLTVAESDAAPSFTVIFDDGAGHKGAGWAHVAYLRPAVAVKVDQTAGDFNTGVAF